MLERLTIEEFQPHVGERFVLEGAGGRVELMLVQAREAPAALHVDQMRKPFSLLFRGPGDRYLQASMYNLRNDRMGLLEGVFICPVVAPPGGQLGQGVFFEAVFS